jgi:hypothetical protein
MLFTDRLELGSPKRTKEGFLAVRARAARAGIYDYLGRELDPSGAHFRADQIVKVYRPAEEVFSRDAVHSFLLKPITNDHPSVPVTADNWKQHARGVNAGAMRDGDFLAFDLVLMDKATIADVESGKRELSNGYSSEIHLAKDGKHPDGTVCDAWQGSIRGNHIALVQAGRAGPECRIGDHALCDAIQVDVLDRLLNSQTYRDDLARDNFHASDSGQGQGAALMLITIDSIPFELSDQAAAAVRKLQGQLSDAVAAQGQAETALATITTQLATKDAELVTVKAQLDSAKLTPAQLRDAAASFQRTVDKAKALGVAVTDSMDEPAIIKAAVLAKVGDAAKDWNDAQLAASFATLAADTRQADPVRQALGDRVNNVVVDGAALRNHARSSRYARAN